MVTKKQLIKIWDDSYGEDLKADYSGFYKLLSNNFTLRKVTALWDHSYGENFRLEYSGAYRELKKLEAKK